MLVRYASIRRRFPRKAAGNTQAQSVDRGSYTAGCCDREFPPGPADGTVRHGQSLGRIARGMDLAVVECPAVVSGGDEKNLGHE